MAGYSATPLSGKLGIKPGFEIHSIDAPAGYRQWLDPLPAGTRFAPALAPSNDMVHVFASRRDRLLATLQGCRTQLGPSATVWVSWPKKSSKLPSDVSEDTIRELALPMGFVDVKVCAVDEVWSGLKLVVRKALR